MRNDPFGGTPEPAPIHIEMPAFTKARGKVVDGIKLADCSCGGPLCGECATRTLEKLAAPEMAGSTVKGFRFDDEPVVAPSPKGISLEDGEFRKSRRKNLSDGLATVIDPNHRLGRLVHKCSDGVSGMVIYSDGDVEEHLLRDLKTF
jgi:hypothetical protein